jgi:Tse2 ADP-ribosyltransferase toxins
VKTLVDLFAFGSKAKPREPRRDDDIYTDDEGNVGPEYPDSACGVSTFANIDRCTLKGHYFLLPAGTELPDDLDVVSDGVDVQPESKQPPTHHTIFPTRRMSWNHFVELIEMLPWQYAGKKK